MAELMIGGIAAAGFILLVQSARARALTVTWWQWGLTVLGFLYGVFVVEVVVSFLEEGTPKGAVVMGTILGFIAIVWGVLLGRFVFRAGQSTAPAEAPQA